jgi:hypothetical protein
MISFTKKPKFSKTLAFLENAKKLDPIDILHKYGELGVAELSKATPIDSGAAASSWSYEITGSKVKYRLSWKNSDMAGQVPTVILLQYGHGTRGGTYVEGRDFINPAIRPIFDGIVKAIVEEVVA